MATEDETATESSGTKTNTPPETISYGAYELSRLEAEHEEAKAGARKAAAAVKTCKKRLESYGIDMAAFMEARNKAAEDPASARAHLSKVGEYLRAMRSDLGFQFDMFDEPSREDQTSRWRFEGYQAYLSGQTNTDCPHRQGDAGHKPWMDGYMDGAKVVAAGMARVTNAEEADTDDAVDEADDSEDIAEQADAEGVDGLDDLRALNDVEAFADFDDTAPVQ